MHIPAARLHLVRYYGHYSHVARARRRQPGGEGAAEGGTTQGSPDIERDPARAPPRREDAASEALVS